MKEKILKLQKEGLSYSQIAKQLNCSKSTVCYHCGEGQKEKFSVRQRKNRAKNHPFKSKIANFSKKTAKVISKKLSCKNTELLRFKIRNFSMSKSHEYQKPTFTVEDVVKKFGDTPKCYLSGESIDINKPRTYHFDHIIPRSKGGDNSIDNLGICTAKANKTKSDMSVDELLMLCKKILETNGFKVNK